MHIALELFDIYFDKIVHTYACQHFLTTGMCSSFVKDEALLSKSSPLWTVSLGKNAHNSEPHGIFGSNFGRLSI